MPQQFAAHPMADLWRVPWCTRGAARGAVRGVPVAHSVAPCEPSPQTPRGAMAAAKHPPLTPETPPTT